MYNKYTPVHCTPIQKGVFLNILCSYYFFSLFAQLKQRKQWYTKRNRLRENIKIQLIYLLSKHTYIQRLKSSFLPVLSFSASNSSVSSFTFSDIYQPSYASARYLLLNYKVDIPSVYDKEVLTPNLLFDRHN